MNKLIKSHLPDQERIVKFFRLHNLSLPDEFNDLFHSLFSMMSSIKMPFGGEGEKLTLPLKSFQKTLKKNQFGSCPLPAMTGSSIQ
jgi:hypothetical protein